VLVGAAAFGVYQGSQGKLPASLQSLYDQYLGKGGSPSAPAPVTGCDAASVTTWAADAKLPTWIGTLFCADQGHLPTSIDELTAWGKTKGYLLGGAWYPPAGSG